MSDPICIFGEVLFDHFPDGAQVLGGAPFNVAWNLRALGQDVRFISRVGDDPEGDRVRQAMEDWGMQTGLLQRDAEQPTGKVQVSLDSGEPAYDIVAPCAYDRIQAIKPSPACGVIYHGTLALRDSVSRASLAQLLEHSEAMVFVDVNLRPPWWDRDTVLALMQRANWVKLNTAELAELSDNPTTKVADLATAFVEQHALQGLILTHGSKGAEVLTAAGETFTVSPTDNVEVVDTVGAGDAFASVMLLGLARGWPLHSTLDRAQGFASALVGQRGATVPDRTYYQQFIERWS